MNTKQLESFLITAESTSLATAAEKLYLSTPALSKQLSALEKELGFSLFNRNFRGIQLTEAGKCFYQEMSSLQTAFLHAIEKARLLSNHQIQHITVGAYGSDIDTMIPAFYRTFTENFPNIPVSTHSISHNKINSLLLEHQIDLCFIYGYNKNHYNQEYLRYEKIIDDEALCIVPKSLKLNNKKSLNLNDLIGHRLMIVREGNDVFHDAIHKEIKEKNLPIRLTLCDEGIVDGKLKGRLNPLIFIASRLSIEHSKEFDYIPFDFHQQKIEIGVLYRKENELFYHQQIVPLLKNTFKTVLLHWHTEKDHTILM